MVEIIASILQRILTAVGLVLFVGILVPDILTVGPTTFQSTVVLSFYIYCIISLFTYSKHKLFFVLSIPVLTQFIHIFQRYDFTLGANSLWRLLPFIILDIYLIYFLFKKYTPNNRESGLILLWVIANTTFLIISPNLSKIFLGGFILYLVTLPLFFIYLSLVVQASNFHQELEKYLCLIFIILGVGTFGLVFMSAGYKGSDNLLVTRNIADTNTTMAYFILLWPFAILYAIHNRTSVLFNLGLLFIFVGVVILSFSRGAVFLVLPYLCLTCFLTTGFIGLRVLLVPITFFTLFQQPILEFIKNQDLLYFWQLRFADLGTSTSFLSKLETVSGRAEIHHTAYSLFLRNPVLGNGIGSFEVMGPGYREAHSLWYTLLAEQGIIGVIFLYSLLLGLIVKLFKLTQTDGKKFYVILFALLFFMLFNHTVGSTFVILPGNSITINCIAPVLLICIYFYAVGFQMKPDSPNRNRVI